MRRTCDVEAGTRTCSGCGKTLPATREFFHKKSASPDGCYPRCKPCSTEAGREWREANPEQAKEANRKWCEANRERKAENNRKWREENPERKAENNRKWRKANPEKIRAQTTVENALKANRLTKPTQCEDCGRGARLHGHHSDYTRPLEVNWLCPLCHSARHSETLHLRPVPSYDTIYTD